MCRASNFRASVRVSKFCGAGVFHYDDCVPVVNRLGEQTETRDIKVKK